MKLENIEILAGKEHHPITVYIELILLRIEEQPLGASITIPEYLIPQIEAYCDGLKIPIYKITKNAVSVAKTYSNLLSYEQGR